MNATTTTKTTATRKAATTKATKAKTHRAFGIAAPAPIIEEVPVKKAPAKRKGRDSDLVFVPGVGTVLPAKKAPAKRTAKAAAKKAPAKAAAKRTPANKAAAAKVAAVYNADVVAARIKQLRSEGVAWRPLSVTLNAEGIKTVRGSTWSLDGASAFRFAGIHGVR